MKTIHVCVGSSCFLRGAPEIIESFQALIATHGVGEVVLKGMFCQEKCSLGVTVRVGEQVFTGVTPADVERIYREFVLTE